MGPPLAHLDGVPVAEFSPDGRWVATGSEDRTAIVWDAATGARVSPPLVHGSYVLCLAFSPDGRLLATGSADGTARVWDIRSGLAVTPPWHHEREVRRIQWSPDGSCVATSDSAARVRLWDIAPQAGTLEELRGLAELLCAHRLDSNGGFVPLTAGEQKTRWDKLRKR